MAAPLVLGLLGNRVRTGGLNPAGLGNLLMGEKDTIMRALPAGLGSTLGLKDLAGISVPNVSAPSTKRWLVPALAALAVVLVVWAMGRNRKPADQAGGAMSAGMAPPPADTSAAPASTELKFVCGTENISFGHIGDRAVLTTSSGSFDLRPVTTASGAKYVAVTDSTTSFWNKGDKGTLEIKGTKLPECTAAH
jgi:membrane-bound inhibitor of C-type lysozyme